MFRILAGTLVSLSLVLWMTTVCVWARSYWRWDRYRVFSAEASDYDLTCDGGCLTLNVTTDDLWLYHPFAHTHWQRDGRRHSTGPARGNTFRPGRSF